MEGIKVRIKDREFLEKNRLIPPEVVDNMLIYAGKIVIVYPKDNYYKIIGNFFIWADWMFEVEDDEEYDI